MNHLDHDLLVLLAGGLTWLFFSLGPRWVSTVLPSKQISRAGKVLGALGLAAIMGAVSFLLFAADKAPVEGL